MVFLDMKATESRPAACPESALVEDSNKQSSIRNAKHDAAGSSLVRISHQSRQEFSHVGQ